MTARATMLSYTRLAAAPLIASLVLATAARGQALQPFYDLPAAQHPESVTFDPVQRAFYAGSILAKGVVRVDGVTGATSSFLAATELPFLAITGLRADPVARSLWVCNVEPAGQVAYAAANGPAEAIQSGLAQVDLDTGQLRAFVYFALVPGVGLPGYLCNDITLDDGGNAYVSESVGGRVLRVAADGSSARLLVVDARLARNVGEAGSLGVNGIAYSPRDRHVYLSNPANGRMFRFPADSVAPLLEEVLLEEPVYGDGLIIDPTDGKAYAVSSVPGSTRVVKQVLVNSARLVKKVRIIPWPAIPREFESPTAGTYAEGRFYVADAAFSRLQSGNDTVPGLFFGVDLGQ